MGRAKGAWGTYRPMTQLLAELLDPLRSSYKEVNECPQQLEKHNDQYPKDLFVTLGWLLGDAIDKRPNPEAERQKPYPGHNEHQDNRNERK